MKTITFLCFFLALISTVIRPSLSFQQPIINHHHSFRRSSQKKITTTRTISIMSSSSTTTKITEIKTDDAPDPLGPYSQAVLAGNTIYCSGNIAIDPKTNELLECNGDVKVETRQVLKNMDAVLRKAGATASNVVRCTVFLDDLSNFNAVNEIYAEYFKDSPVAPSRSCVQAAALPKNVKVEIDCIAVL